MENVMKASLYNLKKVENWMILCFVLFVMMGTSCEQRDPQAEYEILSEKVFSSPNAGEEAAQEYIDYFYNKKRARITEVSEIRHQYRQMDAFLSKSFSSYADFISQGRELNEELSQSTYYGVRKTWTSLYEKERDRLLGPLMDSITESMFDDFFKTQVRQLCESEFTIWEIEAVDQVYLSTPTLMNEGIAKKANGEYLIHLRGNVLGLVTKTARISIEGTIGVGESGELDYVRTGYQFLQKPIL